MQCTTAGIGRPGQVTYCRPVIIGACSLLELGRCRSQADIWLSEECSWLLHWHPADHTLKLFQPLLHMHAMS